MIHAHGIPVIRANSFLTSVTLKPSNVSGINSPELEAIFLHGACSAKTLKIQKLLCQSATGIMNNLAGCRVHIYSFDALKLFHGQKSTLHHLVDEILERLKKISGKKRVAFIGHNIAVWVIRAALVQSQYDKELEDVPVGIIDFGLPKDPSETYSREDWNNYCSALLGTLAPPRKRIFGIRSKGAEDTGPAMEGKQSLSFDVMCDTAKDFKKFVESLDKALTVERVLCPEMKGVPRRDTAGSQNSDSSTESIDYALHMFVPPNPEEIKTITMILKEWMKKDPVPIPTITEQRMKAMKVQPVFIPSNIPFRDESSPPLQTSGFPAKLEADVTASRHDSERLSNVFAQGAAAGENLHEIQSIDGNEQGVFVTERRDSWRKRLPTTAEKSEPPFKQKFHFVQSQEIASQYLQDGDLHEAKRLHDILIKWCDNMNFNDLGYFKMKLQVGQINFAQGNYKDSERLLTALLIAQYNTLDMQYRESKTCTEVETALTSEIARFLALSLWKLGDYTGARNTLHQCEERLKKLANIDLDNVSESTLALVLAYSGRFQDAWCRSRKANFKILSNQGSKEQEDLDGPQRICLVNHARILCMVGKLEDAEKHNRKALASMKIELGPEHFITLDASSLQAWLLVAQSKTTQAENVAHQTLREIKHQLGVNHPLKLQNLETLVQVYKNDGRYADAEQAALKSVEQNAAVLGENHPQTLKSKSILAEVLLLCGRWSQAEEIQRAVLEEETMKWEKNTSKHWTSYPDLYLYRTTLANILLEKGAWQEARELSLKVLVEQLNTFAKEGTDATKSRMAQELFPHDQERECIDHVRLLEHFEDSKVIRDVLVTLRYKYGVSLEEPLAIDLTGTRLNSKTQRLKSVAKDRPDAPVVLVDSLAAEASMRNDTYPAPPGIYDSQTPGKRGLIKIYPSIVQTLHCLALTEQARDDADLLFSRRILKMVRKLRVQRLTKEHRLTVNVLYDLAVNYRLSGKLRKSFDALEEVVGMRKNILGVDHPDYLRARHQQAVTRMCLGKWKEAQEIQRQTVQLQAFLLGKRHPDTIFSNYTLGGIYHSLDRLEDAHKLLRQVIDDQIECYGDGHTLVLRSRARLALVLLDRGPDFLQAAKKEQKIVLRHRKAQLSESLAVKSYLTVRSDYALIIQSFGGEKNINKALELYKKLEEDLPVVEDPDPYARLRLQLGSNQGTCYFELGSLKEIPSEKRLRYLEEARRIQFALYNKVKMATTKPENNAPFITMAFNLALTVRMMGNFPEATTLNPFELLRESEDAAARTFGRNHPYTLQLNATRKGWEKTTNVLASVGSHIDDHGG